MTGPEDSMQSSLLLARSWKAESADGAISPKKHAHVQRDSNERERARYRSQAVKGLCRLGPAQLDLGFTHCPPERVYEKQRWHAPTLMPKRCERGDSPAGGT